MPKDIINPPLKPLATQPLSLKSLTPAPQLPRWTPNYNGVNSYVEIPEWRPEGDFEVELVLYVEEAATGFRNIVCSLENTRLRLVRQDGTVRLDGFTGGIINATTIQSSTTPFPLGLNHLKLNGRNADMGIIGARFDGDEPFKGQLQSLRLTDLENPTNSRFYESIIESDTMPQETVLVDRWCEPEDVTFIEPSDSDYWSNNGETWSRSDLPDGISWEHLRIKTPVSGTGVYEVSIKSATGSPSIYYRNNGYNKSVAIPDQGGTFIVNMSDEHPLGVWLNKKSSAFSVTGVSVRKVTHGLLKNFGTTQPWVPVLGDDPNPATL